MQSKDCYQEGIGKVIHGKFGALKELSEEEPRG
ncbi:hypothetical protein N483_23435 [Pseudoalteromonas luteoviolacea NCIMB 1944]|nr:hypothetical protein N483_23435 [Pseudoalteromonas luteoviolacea NCIMB 1944]